MPAGERIVDRILEKEAGIPYLIYLEPSVGTHLKEIRYGADILIGMSDNVSFVDFSDLAVIRFMEMSFEDPSIEDGYLVWCSNDGRSKHKVNIKIPIEKGETAKGKGLIFQVIDVDAEEEDQHLVVFETILNQDWKISMVVPEDGNESEWQSENFKDSYRFRFTSDKLEIELEYVEEFDMFSTKISSNPQTKESK